MRAELANPNCYYLVATLADDGGAAQTVDGYAGLLAPQGSAESDIQTIAVAPLARRRGLGRTLALALLAEARHRGAQAVFLEVRADNPGPRTSIVPWASKKSGCALATTSPTMSTRW